MCSVSISNETLSLRHFLYLLIIRLNKSEIKNLPRSLKIGVKVAINTEDFVGYLSFLILCRWHVKMSSPN